MKRLLPVTVPVTVTLTVTAGLALLVSATAADAGSCRMLAAAGDAPTEQLARVMSTHGLDNIIEAKGLKGVGPVKTSCKAGTLMVECRSQQKACN